MDCSHLQAKRQMRTKLFYLTGIKKNWRHVTKVVDNIVWLPLTSLSHNSLPKLISPTHSLISQSPHSTMTCWSMSRLYILYELWPHVMLVSEMTVTRHVTNGLAGKYRWVHTMKRMHLVWWCLANISRRQVSAEWTQKETLQIIAWVAMCTLCADNYK